MKTSNVCYCREQTSSTILPGYCSTCHGTLADTPESQVKPSTLEELISLKSQFVENVYLKTLKVMKLFKSSSTPNLPENQKHKRSNTINKLTTNEVIPEEGPGINKINCLKIESHPNTRNPSIDHSDPSQSASHKSLRLNLEKALEVNCKNISSKHHDRAFSSRIESSFYPDLLASSRVTSIFKDISISQQTKGLTLNGHKNAVKALAIAQGKLFSAGSDYKILAWPKNEISSLCRSVQPSGGTPLQSRGINSIVPFVSKYLVSAGNCPKIKIWSIGKSLSPFLTLTSPDPCTSCILTTARQVLSAGCTGHILLWDIEHRSVVKSHAASRTKICSLIEFSNNLYISGSNDGKASLIDFRCLRNVADYSHFDPVVSVIRCQNQTFYSAADKLRRWDIRKGSVLFFNDIREVKCMEWANNKLVTGGKSLNYWQDDFLCSSVPNSSVINCVKYNENSDLLYIGCGDGKIVVKYI